MNNSLFSKKTSIDLYRLQKNKILVCTKWILPLLFVSLFYSANAQTPADLYIYEPFDYTVGRINSSNISSYSSGLGLTGDLTISGRGNFAVSSTPTLSYSGLVSKGNYYAGGGGDFHGTNTIRSVDLTNVNVAPLLNADGTVGKPGTTLYLGFVIYKSAQWTDQQTTIKLFNNDPNTDNVGTNSGSYSHWTNGGNYGKQLVEFGYFQNTTTLGDGSLLPIQITAGGGSPHDYRYDNPATPPVHISAGNASLLVLKMEFGSTEHTFTGYVNPPANGVEPSTPDVGPVFYSGFDAVTSGFSKIAWSFGNDEVTNAANGFMGSGAIDEIRIAGSYKSAAPNVAIDISATNVQSNTIFTSVTTVQFNGTVNTAASNIAWSQSSSPGSIATIDPSSGLLTLNGTPGTVTVTGSITAPFNLSNSYILNVVAPVSATGISISGVPSGKLNLNDVAVLSASYLPAETNELGINWSSSNPSIVSVSNGTITAVSIGTTVTITATYALSNTIFATKLIDVTQPVTSVGIAGVSSIFIGNNTTLTGDVAPISATDKSLVWTSSDATIATVGSATGVVSSLAVGTVTITATSVNNSAAFGTFQLTVLPITVTSISLSGIGTVTGLVATTITSVVLPANATNSALNWASSNTAVATVDQFGNVTPIAIGTVTVTATSISSPNVSSNFVLVISPVPVSSISITGTNLFLIGASSQLSAAVLPANATTKSIIWASSDPTIASVSGTGLVKGLSVGTVTITATSVSTPSVSASYQIGILPINVTSVGISGKKNLTVGGVTTLTASVLPASATDKSIVWSSSDETIASISTSTGILTAISAGTVTITAQTLGTPSVSATFVLSISGGTQTATNEESTLYVSLYPNPVVDELHVGTTETIKSIKVVSLFGSVVAANINATSIGFEGLSSGLYIIQLVTDKGVSLHKVVKK